LSIPATDESIHCWAMGKSESGMPIQITPRKAIRPRSALSTGLRAAGMKASAAAPNRTRTAVITPGLNDSRAASIKTNDEPQMRAMEASNPHSEGPKASSLVPAPLSRKRLRGAWIGVAISLFI
jgi:hypothetical protein